MNNIAELREVCRQNRPAAILVEPILGAGGVVSLSESFLRAIDDLCAEEEMLFCVDEIQTGMGRTGTLFAYQQFDLTPDVILFAKGIGGGLPLGGIIAGERAADVFKPGDHGTTFAPSPLSAAMGNAVLDVLLEEGGLEQGKQRADYLWRRLEALKEKYPHLITGMDGRGMMIGIRTSLSAENVIRLQKELLTDGILVNVTAKTVIRLLPPLTLKREETDFFIQALEKRMLQIAD